MTLNRLQAGAETGATAANKINAIIDYLTRNTVDSKLEITVSPEGNDDGGYDFNSLEDALQFALKATVTPFSKVTIKLEDGNYYLEENPSDNEVPIFYQMIGARIKIAGNGSDKTNISIGENLTKSDIDGATIFQLASMVLQFENLNIDLALTGIEPSNVNFISGENSMVTLYGCNVSGFGKDKGCFIYNSFKTTVYTSDTLKVSNFRVFDYYSSNCLFSLNTLTLKSISYDTGMGISEYVPTSNVYTIPNIEYDDVDSMLLNRNALYAEGGSVSNGWKRDMPPNMFRWAGTTDDRPDLSSYNIDTWGGCYADTDLGKPIWWINGKWVDSSGAEV